MRNVIRCNIVYKSQLNGAWNTRFHPTHPHTLMTIKIKVFDECVVGKKVKW